MSRTGIICAGHPDRGDDAAGLHVADLLRAQGLEVHSGAADAAAVLAQMEGLDCAIAVDCARGGGTPGTILQLPASAILGQQSRPSSSHGNALAGALALGDALGCLPPRITLFVIAGQNFAIGAPLSAGVRAALPELVRRVIEEAACTKPN